MALVLANARRATFVIHKEGDDLEVGEVAAAEKNRRDVDSTLLQLLTQRRVTLLSIPRARRSIVCVCAKEEHGSSARVCVCVCVVSL